MNCENCGAPMTLMPEREFFLCEYCGTYSFPTESHDGVRLLGQTTVRERCPLCGEPLNRARLDERHPVLQCERCEGLLIDRERFSETLERRRGWAGSQPDPVRPLDRSELKRRLKCPRCRTPMSTHPYYGAGNVVIDTCDRCNLIWLDRGEMGRLVNAPGLDRGAAIRRQLERD
jgi:Zn-finger nucleic acid-binding protein